MAERQSKSDCVEHTIDINNLKKDMETVKRHEEKFNRTVERVEASIDTLNDAVLKINMNLEHWKDIPDKIRKLEDKSVFLEVIEKVAWIAVGAMVAGYISQTYVIPKEKYVQHEKIASK